MQVFRFIFMARSWEQDKKNLSQKLDKLAERVTRSLDPLALMICKACQTALDDGN